MQTIDSGSCRTSSAAGQAGVTQGFTGFRGSSQDRADQLVRATVLSDLGQSVGHGRHSHGIQGVAAAIRKVLSGQDVTGTDAADDVLKKIETSLHKAAQALADRGVDAKTIDATIDRFRAQLANALDGMSQGAQSSGSTNGGSTGTTSGSASGSTSGSGSTSNSGSGTTSGAGTTSGGADAPSTPPAPAPASPTSVSQFVAREVRKERGAIDLVTAEGDRVSIRFRTKEVVMGSVTQSTAADGTTTTATKASAFSRGGVKIEVDGDLNEDELKAIGDLLGKVDDIATQFFSGDVQAAFSAAGSLGVDSDQIAAYRLNLTYSRKIAAAYEYSGVSLPVSTQPPASSSTGDGTTPADAANESTTASSGASSGASSSATSAPSSAGSASASASSPTSTDSAPSNSDSVASASESASGSGATTGSTAGDAGTVATDGATDGVPTTSTSDTSDTSPATTPPASAQKTIIDFISDALSKLNSVNGAGRISFSMNWKTRVLVTALQSVQPAQPTTAADQASANNTQLLSDSLQKIATA